MPCAVSAPQDRTEDRDLGGVVRDDRSAVRINHRNEICIVVMDVIRYKHGARLELELIKVSGPENDAKDDAKDLWSENARPTFGQERHYDEGGRKQYHAHDN